jgi:hypothetical protein
MTGKRDKDAEHRASAEATPVQRSLTELGSPRDPSLVQEIETPDVTPELLEATGMRRLFDVWRDAALGVGRSMPSRSDIDILQLTTYIGELSLLEVVDNGADFRYRVLSGGAAKLLGRDYTGMLLSETAVHRDKDRVERLMHRYRRVVSIKVPWYARTPAVPEMPVLYTERLVLPLSDDGIMVNMILMARKSGPRRPRT